MRVARFPLACIPVCLILSSSACSHPYATNEDPAGPASTVAIIGFPWDKVDFRFADALGFYRGYVAAGDSAALYFASKSGSDIPAPQLDTVRTAYWSVGIQSTRDTTGVLDARGDSAIAVMELRENGRGMLKPRKPGYFLSPLPRVENRRYLPTVYACRGADCVKVKIVSQ